MILGLHEEVVVVSVGSIELVVEVVTVVSIDFTFLSIIIVPDEDFTTGAAEVSPIIVVTATVTAAIRREFFIGK